MTLLRHLDKTLKNGTELDIDLYLNNPILYETYRQEEQQFIDDEYAKAMKVHGIDFHQKPLPTLKELKSKIKSIDYKYNQVKGFTAFQVIIDELMAAREKIQLEINAMNYITTMADQEYRDAYEAIYNQVAPYVEGIIAKTYNLATEDDGEG